MAWLKRMVRDWLHGAVPEPSIGAGGQESLHTLASSDNPSLLMVVPIDNGFLVMDRKYNPSGPDSINAMFAADFEDLSAALANRLAHARLKL